MRTLRLRAGATIVLLILAACTQHEESAQKGQDDARQRHPETDAAMGHAVERWSALSRDVPTLLDLLNSRIELQAGKLTTNTERDALANERAALVDLRSGWLQAGSAFASGQAIEAVKAAENIERRARESLRRLGP